jgi:hypothetical protein
MQTYKVTDRAGKVAAKTYYTLYHAEQMARALNLHEATHFSTYYGSARFVVESL